LLPFLLLVLGCGCAMPPASYQPCGAPLENLSPSLRLVVDGRALRDASGRQVLLRGINVGGRSKLPPFFPFEFRESGQPDQAGAPPFDGALAQYAERICGWGLNVVRLVWIWEALEPERGQYDEKYLERYLAMVRAFTSRGVRVVVDFHQDVYARPYCGDGFPRWACPQPVADPAQGCSSWYAGYQSNPDVRLAFDRFWRNEDGLQDAFIAAWRLMASRTWPEDGVIGFDIINEPSPGSTPKAKWYAEALGPFYTRLATALTSVAPGALLFAEPDGFDGPTGQTELGRPEGTGFVLAPHYYNPLVFLYRKWTGDSDLREPIGSWDAVGQGWGVPLFLGEFGVTPTVDGGLDYLRALYDALDHFGTHGTLWEVSRSRVDWNDEGYSVLDADGRESPLVEGLVRAYPRALAGTLHSFTFEAKSRAGSLSWETTPNGVTEIAAATRLYPDGVEATLEGVPGCVAWDPQRQALIAETWTAGSAQVSFRPR
jgi:endoglycosylceramidase